MGSQLAGRSLAVLGGDNRELIVVEELIALGAIVHTVGLPLTGDNQRLFVYQRLEDAVKGVEAIILPMPGIDNNGNIRCIFTQEPLTLNHQVMEQVAYGIPVFVGVARPKLRELATIRGLKVVEIAELDDVAILNSIPSAEGALQIAMEQLPITIHGSNSYVLGFGRVGVTMARMLAALGAKVTVVARKAGDLARITELGYRKMTYAELGTGTFINEAEIIFNTVPALILPRSILEKVSKEALIIDLASDPGGTDFIAAQELGIKALLAPGLPGKVAPKTAGRILASVLPDLITQELSLTR